MFSPDSAEAGSEFSGNYLIDFAINGAGLPDPFTAEDEHAVYARNNHWTTRAGALAAGNAWADFFFDAPQTIGTFYMWNHRSDGVASDGGYAITRFNLELFDSADNLLGGLTNESATPGVFTAQAFGFAAIDNVSRIRLTILENNGSPSFTGVGEVAFDDLTVPAPGGAIALSLAGLGAMRRRRK
ncbi:MAG: hypothetical protein AAGG07_11200 [Planctomycetota bacterium]